MGEQQSRDDDAMLGPGKDVKVKQFKRTRDERKLGDMDMEEENMGKAYPYIVRKFTNEVG